MNVRYVAVAESDIGIVKDTNQDSVLLKHAAFGTSKILMAIICDGIGGLSKGEIASATVIREFDEWFTKELPFELQNLDMSVIGAKWSLILKTLNLRIQEYGKTLGERLGTTFTGVLFINNQYVVVHVGDTRLYYIGTSLNQLTSDQTLVAREILKGKLTQEQALIDKRRHVLLQCVGASKTVEPEIFCGETKQGFYMLCSDGFRHKITEEEISNAFSFASLKIKRSMLRKCQKLIKTVKQRKEKDNISVILIKTSISQKNKNRILKRLFSTWKKACLFGAILLILSIIMLVCGFWFL